MKYLPEIAVNKLLNYLEEFPIEDEASFLLRPTKNPLSPNSLNKALNPKSVDYILKNTVGAPTYMKEYLLTVQEHLILVVLWKTVLIYLDSL